MKYLGNIVTDSKLTTFDYYNVVKTKDKIIEDIPTLIVGYEKTKSIYGDNFSVLDWKIEDNVYWTYGRRERGEKYLENIEKFKNLCFNDMVKTVDYRLFNVLVESTERKKEFFNYIKDKKNKTIYISDDMVYLYEDNKHVIGFSLRDVEYGGGNKKRILSILLSDDKNNILNSKDVFNNEFSYTLKNKPYIIPYLYS